MDEKQQRGRKSTARSIQKPMLETEAQSASVNSRGKQRTTGNKMRGKLPKAEQSSAEKENGECDGSEVWKSKCNSELELEFKCGQLSTACGRASNYCQCVTECLWRREEGRRTGGDARLK